MVSTNQSNRSPYLPQLTGLRFFAAVAVIFCHFSSYIFPNQPDLIAKFTNGLYNAVSLFFVLSGFILAHTYGQRFIDHQVTYAKYIVARLARIYPVFLFTLILALPVFIVNNRHDFEGSTMFHMFQKVLLLQTWIPIPSDVTHRWNAPSWSLSTELFFYLVFPLLVAKTFPLSKHRSTWALAGILMAVTGVSFLYDFYFINAIPPTSPAGLTLINFIAANPLVRVLEFIAGVLLYNLYRHYSEQANFGSRMVWNSILIALTAIYAWVNVTGTSVVIGQGICTIYFSFLILGLSLDKFSWNSLLKDKLIVLLGESSYSLYLIHMPIFHSAFMICRKAPMLEQFKVQNPTIFGLFLLAVSVASSIACYKWIEKPGRIAILTKFTKAQPISPQN